MEVLGDGANRSKSIDFPALDEPRRSYVLGSVVVCQLIEGPVAIQHAFLPAATKLCEQAIAQYRSFAFGRGVPRDVAYLPGHVIFEEIRNQQVTGSSPVNGSRTTLPTPAARPAPL